MKTPQMRSISELKQQEKLLVKLEEYAKKLPNLNNKEKSHLSKLNGRDTFFGVKMFKSMHMIISKRFKKCLF